MVCPVCISNGAVVAVCRFFGVPDSVTGVFIGVLTLALAIVTLNYLKDKLLINKAPRGSLIFILAVYLTITFVAMRLIGMF